MKIYKLPTDRWFLERAVFLISGIFILSSVLLGVYVSAYFFIFTGLVGGMMINFSLTGLCPIAILLHRLGVKEK